MMLASAWMVAAGVVVVLAAGAAVVYVALSRKRAKRLTVWRGLRNGLTPDEVRRMLGEPRAIVKVEDGEKWDYGSKSGQESVLFTYGTVSGYIKPF